MTRRLLLSLFSMLPFAKALVAEPEPKLLLQRLHEIKNETIRRHGFNAIPCLDATCCVCGVRAYVVLHTSLKAQFKEGELLWGSSSSTLRDRDLILVFSNTLKGNPLSPNEAICISNGKSERFRL